MPSPNPGEKGYLVKKQLLETDIFMCTLVILRRPAHRWPLIIAANRDELLERPWEAPARHWPERPKTVGGLDKIGGGSWLGVNDYGLIAGVLNRPGTLGPIAGKRSRGELVLEALDHAEATVAADALCDINPNAYRPFNLVVADRHNAFWLCLKEGDKRVSKTPIVEGVSMITAHDLNDTTSPRIGHYLALFQKAAPPNPEKNDWASWQALLASKQGPGAKPEDAMNIEEVTIPGAGRFATKSSSLMAISSPQTAMERPSSVWIFNPGQPGIG
ncbi:MAG: NRDE family protein, partial [Rhodospirillaceae bacterium]|nr:NRDE family protein [Rhodospirillaceae bacterium]